MDALLFRSLAPQALVLSLELVLFFCSPQGRTAHWSYEDPEQWGKLDPSYSLCSSGHVQSPIDVKNPRPADLPPLLVDYQTVPLNIVDNGHTIQVNYPAGSTLSVGDKTYTLKQFHFHHPAEEQIDGRTFPLVAHLVHADSEGHLAVIAVLFESGNKHSLIETLWNNIPAVKLEPQVKATVSVQAKDLLPRELSYFTFAGSLTTPPCTEGVTWYVLRNHATISEAEVDAFAKVYPMNARPAQPANGREILESK